MATQDNDAPHRRHEIHLDLSVPIELAIWLIVVFIAAMIAITFGLESTGHLLGCHTAL